MKELSRKKRRERFWVREERKEIGMEKVHFVSDKLCEKRFIGVWLGRKPKFYERWKWVERGAENSKAFIVIESVIKL